MAISQSKYINIISAVGGTSAVSQRDLMLRVFTKNALVPTGSVLEFTGGMIKGLESVKDYFGITSAEYALASKYFQVNKKGFAPNKISFYKYNSEAVAGQLIGGDITANNTTIDTLKSFTNAKLKVVINNVETLIENINLGNSNSFADVADVLSGVIDGCNVEYNAVNHRFVLSTDATGGGNSVGFAIVDETTDNLASTLCWAETTGAILSDGADAKTPVEAVSESTELSNNYFTLLFLDESELSVEQITDIAEWVNAQNVRYMFSLSVTPANYTEIQSAVASYDGIALTIDKFDENASFMPGSRVASIDYTKPNSAISMMYQQFSGVDASVNTTTEADTYDALAINYYGETSQAGQYIPFYQNGVLQGSIRDMGVYANEAWLKDSFITNLLNMRLALDTLPASSTGLSLVLSSMMETINQALYNGTFLPGKTLDSTQKAYITQLTGESDAWMNVQSTGYYLNANVEKYTENDIEKYKVSFLCVYSKGDSINYIDGRNILI